ncbi:cytochrome P450 2J6 isoform X2 [Chanos chanos]|nr:cytochrome P450 2J6-like isoform X2 [Chanos chanos]XP_030642009.1 cytochrome P450 2J6-like isoform X2 [Chanos chanos]XP_030642010.1 cytochrome P450 2J6-like isoform X2 [Chanos chanos]XP_030642011.1 cytochrome P450 2J6-like isoform X2 [Chanos chanos]
MSSAISALSHATGQWIDTQGVLLFLFVLLLVKYINDIWPRNIPPGPLPLPIVGNLLDVGFKDPTGSFKKLTEKYGDVITLQMGPNRIIVFSGTKIFKEAFVEQADIFTNRPPFPLNKKLGNGLGLILSSGHMWKQQRRFALFTLKHFGVGKKTLENSILQEARYLSDVLEAKKGLPFDPHQTLTNAVANIICSLVFGHRYEYDDHFFHQTLQYSNEVFQLPATTCGRLYNSFPTIMSILPGKHKRAFENLKKVKSFILDEIRKHKEDRNPSNPRDYIDCYLNEIETCKDSQAEFTDDNLVYCVIDLFGAGTETTANTLKWGLLFMAKYPSVQEKVQAEIDQIIGQSRQPTMEDRINLPYTYAVIHEIQRFANIVTFTPPRVANKDTTIGGYHIPKDVLIVPLLSTILHDKNDYATPDQFNPAHFLDENGQFRKRENFIPFSIGKRSCPGEQLAKMELFLFFTCLMQRFTVHAPEGEVLGLKRTVGITSGPLPFNICAVPR